MKRKFIPDESQTHGKRQKAVRTLYETKLHDVLMNVEKFSVVNVSTLLDIVMEYLQETYVLIHVEFRSDPYVGTYLVPQNEERDLLMAINEENKNDEDGCWSRTGMTAGLFLGEDALWTKYEMGVSFVSVRITKEKNIHFREQ